MGGLDTGAPPGAVPGSRRRRDVPPAAVLPRRRPRRPRRVLILSDDGVGQIYDVTRHNGAVSILHGAGIDPWVVDFGSPDQVAGGMERTLADHIVALDEIVDLIHEETVRPVHLVGYSRVGCSRIRRRPIGGRGEIAPA